MPAVLAGLVLAAALAAVMSTSSGALIATATVFGQDILGRLRADAAPTTEDGHVRANRNLIIVFGVIMIVIAALLQDVVAALTIAYDILVGGLLVPILGGLVWRRGTNVGALVAMAVGSVATLTTMIALQDVLANEPVYYGLGTGLVAYVVASLLSAPTPAAVLDEWDRRSGGEVPENAPAG